MPPDAPEFSSAFRADLANLFAWRRDVRHFRTDPLPDGAIDELLRLAALAPSVGNSQPWRFVRVQSPEVCEALAEHVDQEAERAAVRYAPGERKTLYHSLKLHGLREAPEIVAVFSEEVPEAGFGLGIATMPEALRYSTVMAIHSLWLGARAAGIGVGWVSIVDPVTISTLLTVPPSWRFMALLCLGYAEQASAIPELEKRGWQARDDWTDSVVDR